MSCNAARIAVLMLNSPNIPHYGHLAAHLNYKYCAKHGYSFIVERCPRKQDMKKDWMWNGQDEYLFVWSKPTLLRRHLPNYDYVLFIDSDAVFWDHDTRIEDMIQRHIGKGVCVVIGEDCRDKNFCWDKQALNTGSMLVANNPQTIKILDHWIKATENECKDWKYAHTREQKCLQILRDNTYGHQIKTIPYNEINGHDGKWIRHYMGIPTPERIHLFQQHFTKLFQDEFKCSPFTTTHTPTITKKHACIIAAAIATAAFFIIVALKGEEE